VIEGALIALVGVLVGRFLPGRRPKQVKQPKAICGCTHSIGFHEGLTGHCTGLMDKWSANTGTRQVPCTCQHYDGPKSIDTYFAPQLLPPKDS
jgi:hypothetical protein